nr:cycloartenol synthase-like [Ipomoea batatas]
MWKLKLSDGKDDPLLRSVNNHIGRQYWEYDPNLGTQEEREQFEKEKAQEMGLQQVKVGSEEEISEGTAVVRTLRRGLRFYSTIPKLMMAIGLEDLYYPHPAIQDILWDCLHNIIEPLLNKWPFNNLRKKALSLVMDHIQHEDETTNYVCIVAVNKVLNMICRWIEDPDSYAVKLHLSRIKDYLWLAEDGMKMKAYNGSQLWDVDLAVQAILATNLCDEYGSMLRKAHFFINVSQIKEDSGINLSSWYRDSTKGGWTFSTLDQGWPVSDCTAEALEAALMLSRMPDDVVGEAIEPSRLYDAVDLILSLQMLNPSESLGKIIVEYPYVECTSSAIIGLKCFTKLHPGYRRKEIEACINKALTFILTNQLPDGSWYGSYGVCYTYGTWFGIRGLVAGGNTYETCHSIRKACDFLLSKQLPSGGWGESYLSCQDKVYTNIDGNKWHIVNTAWAMMALIEAGQSIMGAFNENGMISCSSYRNIFPIWALGAYLNQVLLPPKT